MMLSFEGIDKGSPLTTVSIPAMTRATLARFAGAADDYNPIHLDDKIAAAMGKTSVFAPQTLVMSYIGRMVEQTFEGGALRLFSLRMMKLVWPGDVLTCRGVVVNKQQDGKDFVIDADVWADNQRGETVAKGRVEVLVGKSEGSVLGKAVAGKAHWFGGVGGSGVVKKGAAGKKKTSSKKKVAAKKKVAKKAGKKKSGGRGRP